MRRFVVGGCLQVMLFAGTSCGAAPADPYRITGREKAACTADAIRLCSHTYPDERALLQCMKTNRPSLSSMCLTAFDAGVKRRRL